MLVGSIQRALDTGIFQNAMNTNNNAAVGASASARQTVHDLAGQQYPFIDEFDPFMTSTLDFDPLSMNHDEAFSVDHAGTFLAPGNLEFPESFNVEDLFTEEFFDMTK